MESLVKEKSCTSCGEQVPENCVRCRMCGEFLHEETRQLQSKREATTSAAEWMVAYSGQQFGPFQTEQLRRAFHQSAVPATALVWKPGMSDWVNVEKVAALKS